MLHVLACSALSMGCILLYVSRRLLDIYSLACRFLGSGRTPVPGFDGCLLAERRLAVDGLTMRAAAALGAIAGHHSVAVDVGQGWRLSVAAEWAGQQRAHRHDTRRRTGFCWTAKDRPVRRAQSWASSMRVN